tara:strand:+ start:1844 stop:2068 length:225 start_codon:yes stop_codon:yes gene_type:complete
MTKIFRKREWERDLIPKTDIDLLRLYQRLKESSTPDFLLVVDVQNELFDRGWKLDDKNEWSWKNLRKNNGPLSS